VNRGLLAGFVVIGALTVIPGFGLYALAGTLGLSPGPGLVSRVLFIWTVNAPAEELAKFLGFVLGARILRSISQPRDGLAQGAATGLGFALVENILYALSGGPGLFFLRLLTSLPGHVIYGAVWGGYYGYEVCLGKGRVLRPWVPLLALVPAFFSHALYNTLILLSAPDPWPLVVDGLTWAFGVFLFVHLRSDTPPGT
jgi:RsiW-degrading membrane proteinase PrsW (M82 family)